MTWVQLSFSEAEAGLARALRAALRRAQRMSLVCAAEGRPARRPGKGFVRRQAAAAEGVAEGPQIAR